MEILAQELAKILNITIDKAIELYPILKQQFIIYKIANSISFVFDVLWIVSMIASVIIGMMFLLDLDYRYCRDNKNDAVIIYKKILKISCLGFVIGLIGLQVVNILQYVLASDFMLIKEML